MLRRAWSRSTVPGAKNALAGLSSAAASAGKRHAAKLKKIKSSQAGTDKEARPKTLINIKKDWE